MNDDPHSSPSVAPASVPPPIADAVRPLGAAPAPSAALRWAAAACAVLFGGLAVASLVLAWRADQRVVHLEQELVKRQQDSAGQANEARQFAKQADEGARDAAAKVALLEARVAEVAVQRSQLEDLIQSLSRSRDENLLVDVEAAIRVALQQSAITGSAEPLVATLKQADDRLARYEQPRLEGVRRAIARDLDRVRNASVTDISSLSIKLDDAVRMVDDLPLLAVAEPRRDAAVPARVSAAPQPPKAAASGASAAAPAASAGRINFNALWPSGVGQVWNDVSTRVWNEAKSLVRVTRIDRPEAMLLAPEQAFFLKENLKLRLLNARLALLSRQFETAQADLQAARLSLDRYFDRSSRRVIVASELLKQVAAQARQVGVPRPDDTLAALATASAGR